MNLNRLLSKKPRHFVAFLFGALLALVTSMAIADTDDDSKAPLIIKKEGNFFVGGTHNVGDQIVGQMYVEYRIPQNQKHSSPIIFVHGGGQIGVGWNETPDGREGWAPYFLRRGFPVYVVDQVARG